MLGSSRQHEHLLSERMLEQVRLLPPFLAALELDTVPTATTDYPCIASDLLDIQLQLLSPPLVQLVMLREHVMQASSIPMVHHT